jgi:3-oxoacyl-[acyl-carrier protein] reductase
MTAARSEVRRNQAVLVFGASRGIGQACAQALAGAGWTVGVACRSRADADTVAQQIRAAGGRALPLVVDVAVAGDVEAAVAAVIAEGCGLAGVVNNAGVVEPIGHLADTDPRAWARLLHVNVVGAYHGMVYALRAMPAGGVIINLSSGAASNAMEGWGAYCASKAALAMLTRVVQLEYGARGALVYGFRPGVVDTGMQASIRASGLNPVSQLQRSALAPVEAPAAGVAWLLAHRPADLAGQELDIRDSALRARMGLAS